MIRFDESEGAIIIDFNNTNTKKRKPSDGCSITREDLNKKRIEELQSQLIYHFQTQRFKALTDLTTIQRKLDIIEYVCKCGEIKQKCFKKILEHGCRECKRKEQYTPVLHPEEYTDEQTGEHWKETRFRHLWVSSHGRIKHNERIIRQDEQHVGSKSSLFIHRNYVSIPRLFYTTFELPNYEMLLYDNTKYGVVVSYRDNNPNNLRIENLYLRDRGEMGFLNLNSKRIKMSSKTN